jgi:hypothetical protein
VDEKRHIERHKKPFSMPFPEGVDVNKYPFSIFKQANRPCYSVAFKDEISAGTTGKLDEAGGPAYVAALTNDVLPGQIQYFTETLARRCRDRKYETAIKLAAEHIGKEPADRIVRDLQNRLEA